MPLLLVKIHVPMLAHKNEYTVFHLSASILKFLQYFEDFALRRLLPDYSKVDDIFYFDYISGKVLWAIRTRHFPLIQSATLSQSFVASSILCVVKNIDIPSSFRSNNILWIDTAVDGSNPLVGSSRNKILGL